SKWKVIAAFIINTKASDDNGYIFNYIFTKMESDEEFMTYIKFLKERSLYDTGVDILPSDKILTLSTCTKDFDDARFVVVARLIRPGETEDVNTSIAKVNESPRYPQAYYDKKKKKNPYEDAERWYYSGS
ncbi:MAG: class B sortase, partial [Acutalibacteraceae bacterium]